MTHALLTEDSSALLLWDAKNKPLHIELMETIYHPLQPHCVYVVREGQSSRGEGWKPDLLWGTTPPSHLKKPISGGPGADLCRHTDDIGPQESRPHRIPFTL